MIDQILITAAGFILTSAVTIVGVSWSLRSYIDQHDDKVLERIEAHERNDTIEFQSVRSQMGEVGSAIRQKITEVELFSRDTFVRRESVFPAIDRMTASLKTDIGEIGNRLGRLETIALREREEER